MPFVGPEKKTLQHDRAFSDLFDLGCKRPPEVPEIACPDCHECFIWACGWSRCTSPNPLWIEHGALCPYEHCIEIFSMGFFSMGFSAICPLFEHECPGGLPQLRECLPDIEVFRKRGVLREQAPITKLMYLKPSDYTWEREHNIRKRFQAYIGKCDRELRTNPSNAGYHFCKGYALAKLEKFEEGIVEFGMAIELDPREPEYQLYKGVALATISRFDEAIEALDAAISLHKMPPSTYHFLKGWVLSQLGLYKKAINEYKTAIEIGRAFGTDIQEYQDKLNEAESELAGG